MTTEENAPEIPDGSRDEEATRDDFYVGYLPKAPPAYARFARRVAVTLLAGGCALALGLAALQGPFDVGVFEFDAEREANGVVRLLPAPRLVAGEPDGDDGERTSVLLVAPFKHGALEHVAPFDARNVTLRGHRIAGPDGEMLELVPGSIVDRGASDAAAHRESLGRFRLRGELVDSKCYLGVMKPGRGKPHRSCAARCLSGGIPALFLVQDEAGKRVAMVVSTRDGAPLPRWLLDSVGEPIELTGEVERVDGMLALRLD